MSKIYTLIRPKRHKNNNLWGGTYLFGLYKGVPPPPPSATPFWKSSGCGILVKKVRECGSGTHFLGRPKSEASMQERMKDSPLSGLNKYVNIFKAIPDVGQKNICTLHKVAEK